MLQWVRAEAFVTEVPQSCPIILASSFALTDEIPRYHDSQVMKSPLSHSSSSVPTTSNRRSSLVSYALRMRPLAPQESLRRGGAPTISLNKSAIKATKPPLRPHTSGAHGGVTIVTAVPGLAPQLCAILTGDFLPGLPSLDISVDSGAPCGPDPIFCCISYSQQAEPHLTSVHHSQYPT